jgi:hypothetical protein
MHVARLKIKGFRGVLSADIALGRHAVLVGLLYNGITRAKNHCTVVVLGQGRLNAQPFAPA